MKTWYNDATTNFLINRKETTEECATAPIAHTPGPWEYGRMLLSPKAKDRRCGFVVNGPDNKPNNDLPTRICDLRVPPGVSGFAEGEANARLIAAAPDLLAAMEAVIDDAEDAGCEGMVTISTSTLKKCREVLESLFGPTAKLPTEKIITDADAYAGAGHFDHHQS